MTIRINIKEIVGLRRRIREIDRLDVAEIEWHRDGVPLSAPAGAVADWLPEMGIVMFAKIYMMDEDELKTIGCDHRPSAVCLELTTQYERKETMNEAELLTTMEQMASMTAQGRLATAIMREVYGDTAPFDPAFWMMIFELITELIQNCPESSRRAVRVANKPRRRARRILKANVMRRMGGKRAYQKDGGDDVVKAMLKSGKTITPDEMEAMYVEAG